MQRGRIRHILEALSCDEINNTAQDTMRMRRILGNPEMLLSPTLQEYVG